MNGAAAIKSDCPVGQVMIERTEKTQKDVDDLKASQRIEFDQVWSTINDLRNRLPNWAVFLIAALTALCGWFAKGAFR